jgi:ABC-type Fe3+-siderophore transport system permease subunit
MVAGIVAGIFFLIAYIISGRRTDYADQAMEQSCLVLICIIVGICFTIAQIVIWAVT